ncbi:MAG: YfhO family protein [Clostridia bacterium]|nr:YfhO family protein [Clostridia bacterium]
MTSLRPQKEKKLSTFLIALFCAAALFVPYMILDEGYFIFYGDFNVQQIPFYQTCHEAIKSGNMSWSWLTDLGSNFIGSYSFYLLGSPFFWLTIPFPNWFVPYLMGPLLILKFACAALTAYLYIRRFTKTAEAARLGGLLYAFSGFSIYNIFFNHFHEAIIFLPLLLLAFEMLITENKRGVFALAVALCAVSNYFFFFGMAVFTVIYFFVRLSTGAIKVKFSRFAAIVLEAVLGVGIACALLLPAVFAIVDNSRVSNTQLGWNAIMYGKEQIYLNVIQCFFFPPDIPARPVFFPGAEVKWSSLGGWLPVFSMVGVFAWFTNRKKSWLKRIIGICAFMAMVPVLNSAFYAFNSSYYARWFYMPILMMSLATVMLTEDRSADWSSGFKWVFGITAAMALVIGFFPQKDENGDIIYGLYTQSSDNMYTLRFWIACLIAIVSLLILYLILGLLHKNRTAFYKTATVCVCIVSVIYGNVFISQGRSHSYAQKEVVIDQLIEGEVGLENSDQYRVDTYSGVDNTSMFLGLPGINAFHSVVPASIMEFYKYVGEKRDVGSRPEVDNYALRPLLSVKYVLNRTGGESFVDENGETKMPGYTYVNTDGGYYIYKNDNYIPYGFSYDYYMSKDFCDSYNEENRAGLMLKAILLSTEQIEKYSYMMTDLNEVVNETTDGYQDKTTLSFSEEAYSYDCAKLADTAAYSFETDNFGFTAKVTRNKESLVFFSVPFDEGWTATVNGKEAEIEKVNVGFMAVKVPEGASTIRFDYETPGLKAGFVISGGSLAILLIYILLFTAYKKNHPTDTEYPEGDILLEQWHSDDIAEAVQNITDGGEQKSKSILDDDEELEIPHINNGFEGGFKIDSKLFDDEEKE